MPADTYPIIQFERVDDERTYVYSRLCGKKFGLMLKGPLDVSLRNDAIAAMDRFAAETMAHYDSGLLRAHFEDEALPYKAEVIELRREPIAA